MLLPSL